MRISQVVMAMLQYYCRASRRPAPQQRTAARRQPRCAVAQLIHVCPFLQIAPPKQLDARAMLILLQVVHHAMCTWVHRRQARPSSCRTGGSCLSAARRQRSSRPACCSRHWRASTAPPSPRRPPHLSLRTWTRLSGRWGQHAACCTGCTGHSDMHCACRSLADQRCCCRSAEAAACCGNAMR